MKALLQLGLGLAASVLGLGALASPGHAQSPRVWRHGIVQAKSDAGFVMMAKHKGFDVENGLNIDYVQFKGDGIALKALIAGDLDSYEGSPGGPIIAAARGADIKIVGCYWPGLTYGIFVTKAVQTPADLKGKVFAISSPGALPDLFARVVLDKYNIPASDVQFAAMGSDADRFRAVTQGVVQAAAASTEFAPLMQQHGVRLLVHAHDVAPNYIRFCTYMSSSTIQKSRDAAVHFLAAEMEGFSYALAHESEEEALARDVTKAKPDDDRAAYVFKEVTKYKAIDPQMPISQAKLEWMRDLLTRTGNLNAPVDIGKMIDGSLREKALALVEKSTQSSSAK